MLEQLPLTLVNAINCDHMMKSIYFHFFAFISLAFIGFTACTPTEKMSQEKKSKVAGGHSPLAVMFDTSEVFNANLTGFELYDPDRESVIYAQNENRYFTPASNTKLFTFYTGLKMLPDSIRALEYVVHGDSLIFWGTGDPSFLHSDLDNGTVYNFLKSREEKLYFSDSNFDDRLLGPGWSWSDYNYYYQTEKSPLPMYGNTAEFEIQDIQLRKIAETDSGPAVRPRFFQSYIDTLSDPEPEAPLLFRAINGNEFEYKPEADTSSYTIDKPYHYTPKLITQMLADTLGRAVSYLPKVPKPDSVNVLYSIAADTAYKHMLRPSDNFIAEQLLLVTASELGKPLNSRSVIDTMKSEYLEMLPKEPQWVDGSGLSRYNLFTPGSIVRLLQAIDNEFEQNEALFDLLPAGGERGTISSWYANRNGGPPYVFAKTGTLSNNHCLSGFLITSSGKKLIFSFMNNHYVTSSSVVKEEMEKILWYIHEHF